MNFQLMKTVYLEVLNFLQLPKERLRIIFIYFKSHILEIAQFGKDQE